MSKGTDARRISTTRWSRQLDNMGARRSLEGISWAVSTNRIPRRLRLEGRHEVPRHGVGIVLEVSAAETDRIELRPAVGLLAAVGLISFLVVGWLVWTVTTHPLPFRTTVPLQGGWRWVFVGIWDSLALFAWAAILWTMYCDVKTIITPDGIERPSLRGPRVLRWRDVKRVRSFGIFGIQFESSTGKMSLWYSSYREPGRIDGALRALVRAKVESGEIRLAE
jgi:hypothetical protein